MLRLPTTAALCGALFAALAPAMAALPPVPAPTPMPTSGSASPTAADGALLPANAVLELEMLDAVDSNTSKRGDRFRMRVVQPVVSGQRVLVPAGSIAIGEVVHAQKTGLGGRAGELILAGRYLELPQGQVKLRSTLGGPAASTGKNELVQATTVTLFFGALGFVVKGGHTGLPVGAGLRARIAEDTRILDVPSAMNSATSTNEPRNSTP